MRIPPEAVDYYAHPTHYLTDHTQADLAGSGIAAHRFRVMSIGSSNSCEATPRSDPQR